MRATYTGSIRCVTVLPVSAAEMALPWVSPAGVRSISTAAEARDSGALSLSGRGPVSQGRLSPRFARASSSAAHQLAHLREDLGAFLGGDAGRQPMLAVDRDGEGGAERRVVFRHHRIEVQFARAVNRDDVDVGFVIALRDDSLSKLDRFQERIPNLLSNRLRLKHLDAVGAAVASVAGAAAEPSVSSTGW